ncbi:MAG: hypothetical protein KY475_08095 [Planctomycetes bacterium]|nr:hypothetical protein [Planctomycetota bacterium]
MSLPYSDHDSSLGLEVPAIGVPGEGAATAPLPVFALDSDEPLPIDPAALDAPRRGVGAEKSPIAGAAPKRAGTPSAAPEQRGGEMWLDGDVVMLACPDCRAPMTVRLWLMIADCWRCGTCIELSEEQQRQAERLLREREARKRAQVGSQSAGRPQPAPSRQPPSAATPRPAKAPAPSRVSAPPEQRKTRPAPPPPPARDNGHAPRRQTAPAPPPSRSAGELHQAYQRRRFQSWLGDTPAWLISLILHLILITLLGLLTFEAPEDPRFITLSNSVSREVVEGDNTQPIDPENEFVFDLPLPQDANLNDPEVREAIVRADQDARELRLPEDAPDPHLPDLENVKEQLRSSEFAERTLAARDPRVRTVLVEQEGGTTLTEAAVARGLRWLARQQKADGRWVLDGGIKSDAAATALAVLPFLGAGQTHLTGRYQKEVAGGLRWLLQNQGEDGDLARGSGGNSHMYAHGQGAIVLCEAFAITGDEQLRIPAQKAIDFIVAAQHPAGGWRYHPGQAGDTSVLGWQLMALQSARAANLTVPPATLENASQYLDSVASHDGSLYAFIRGLNPTEVMSAEAILCRMYLGWTLNDAGLAQGIRWLADNHLPSDSRPNMYYWYYGTQVFHHAGGEDWERWNLHIRDILVNSQEKRGDLAGSWKPEHHHDRPGGRIYCTSLAVCTLEVYYRHTPIFRQIDLD